MNHLLERIFGFIQLLNGVNLVVLGISKHHRVNGLLTMASYLLYNLSTLRFHKILIEVAIVVPDSLMLGRFVLLWHLLYVREPLIHVVM